MSTVEPREELNYGTYLMIDDLLSLQVPRSEPPEHDEMLFIVIHQSYELWFKLMLHEFDKIKADFSAGDLYGALHSFKRTRTVMKALVGQIDIIETMTPMSFTSFRDRLERASGFQSMQFREVEYLLGYKRPKLMKYHKPGSPAYASLQRRLEERSIIRHFYDFLEKRGVAIPDDLRDKPAEEADGPSEPVQRGLLDLYRTDPEATILFELMTDLDEGFQEWRYRHTKLVERTIGNKKGTGGSLGVDFLKASLFQPIFHDLWAIRHEL